MKMLRFFKSIGEDLLKPLIIILGFFILMAMGFAGAMISLILPAIVVVIFGCNREMFEIILTVELILIALAILRINPFKAVYVVLINIKDYFIDKWNEV